MDQNNWNKTLENVRPYVYKIETPESTGTGFQIFYSKKINIITIATALHVIKQSNEWDEIIKITHYDSGEKIILKNSESRVINIIPEKDLALISFKKEDKKLPTENLDLAPPQKHLKQGIEIGWCGFPSVRLDKLCFFQGYISCVLDIEDSYLVDGVAINGVSGGPAFISNHQTNKPIFIGVISAYIPNRSTGETLPGLCVVTSIESYQSSISILKSIENTPIDPKTK